jgi:hypothetical protein
MTPQVALAHAPTERQPGSSNIARRWMALLGVGGVERSPLAVRTFVGYQGVRLYLGQLPLVSWRPPHVEFHAGGDTVVILWRPAVPGCRDDQGALTRMRIQDGRIVEQWVASSAARIP